jgi:YHS domain-containing protein
MKKRIDDRALSMFQGNLMSLQQIADDYGVSRQAVKQFLNARGVSTSKGQFSIVCDECGMKVFKARCKIRGRDHHFCSQRCYYKFLNNPNYLQDRNGQRIGRAKIREVFGPQFIESYIVHHKDGNTLNNHINNLIIFKSQSDHMAYHRYKPAMAMDGVTGRWETIQLAK